MSVIKRIIIDLAFFLLIGLSQASGQTFLGINDPHQLKKTKIHGVVKIVIYHNHEPISVGSGFFINSQGLLVTNFHVLETLLRPGLQAEVSLFNGQRLQEMEILSCSNKNKIDLCLVQTSHKPQSWFEPLPYSPAIGHTVHKIGNGGSMDFNFFSGVTLEREDNIPFLLSYRYDQNKEVEFLEVSVPIFPGDSGGPVFDSRGKLVGMSTLKIYNFTQEEGKIKENVRGMIISSREIYQYVQDSLFKNIKKVPLERRIIQLLSSSDIQRIKEKKAKKNGPPTQIPLVTHIQMNELKQLQKKGRLIIVDVRDPFTYQHSHIPGAINIPYQEKSRKRPDFLFVQDQFDLVKLKKIATTQDNIFFYGQNHAHWGAYKAAKYSRVLGRFEGLYWSKGGIEEWISLYQMNNNQ
jgi:S1-C subfamily serine protease